MQAMATHSQPRLVACEYAATSPERKKKIFHGGRLFHWLTIRSMFNMIGQHTTRVLWLVRAQCKKVFDEWSGHTARGFWLVRVQCMCLWLVTAQSTMHVNSLPDRKSKSRLLTFVWPDTLSGCGLVEAVFVLFLEACKPALCHLKCLSA